VGLPKVGVPAAYLKAPVGSQQAKQVEALKKMVRGIRRNEQEGIVFPLAYDEDTKQPLFTFDLVGSGGTRQFQTDTLIQRYEQRMLMTVLADFIMLGHDGSGTYNMHVDKTGIFKTALNTIANNIADTFNRHAIPRLFAINGWRPDKLPRIVPSDVDAPDLTQLGGFLAQTAGLGFTWNDADMEKFLRDAAGLPKLGDTDFNKHRVDARRQEATRYAENQTAYLAARSTLAQAMAAQALQAQGVPSGADVDEHKQGMQADEDRAMQQEQQGVQGQQAADQHAQTMQSGGLANLNTAATMLDGAPPPPGGAKAPAKPAAKKTPAKK
jgi:hypothetical protein